jgi:tRNA(Ile)-lysidine synthase
VPVTSPSTRRLLSRATFPPAGTPVACAVSGGADSLALLVLGVAAGCDVTAVHVDHGLRPGSAAEAHVVGAAAARFGAAFVAERVEVPPGPNLEARARAARYAALPPGALTGHTADDQAETVLLNLLRGAGLDGLSGMRAGPTKPLLRLRRHETRSLCDEVGLVPIDDPSNADLSLRRNRVRHELLPLLDAIGERDVVAVVARQAALMADDADLLDELAAAIDPTDARALVAAPVALARRAVRRWLHAGCEHPPDSATVERVLAVARGDAKATDIGGGRSVRRSRMRLFVS